MSYVMLYLFFFFKQKTAYEMRISDWSSDVCSSDLIAFRSNLDVCGVPRGSLASIGEGYETSTLRRKRCRRTQLGREVRKKTGRDLRHKERRNGSARSQCTMSAVGVTGCGAMGAVLDT